MAAKMAAKIVETKENIYYDIPPSTHFTIFCDEECLHLNINICICDHLNNLLMNGKF